MKRSRLSAPFLGITGALCLVAALTGTAAGSPAGGVKGDPQPELKPFSLGPAISSGTVAIEPDGSMVVAYDIASGNGKTLVCLLNRGGGKCSTKTTLNPLSPDSTFGTPQVFVTSANHVTVLQETCCDSNTIGGDLVYQSTNGGRTFGPPVRVGTLSVDAAALVGNDVVYTAGLNGSGAQVQSIQVKPTVAVNGPVATVQSKETVDVGISAYKGGVLEASDFLAKSYTTYVEYADSGDSPFTAASSFLGAGTFAGNQLLGLSGAALLTKQGGGKQWVQVRLFDGSKFGSPHNVPGSSGGGPEWFGVDQDPSGAVHVFVARHPVYDLLEYTTTNGSSWSGPVDLGSTNQLSGPAFAAGIDSRGSGVVLGTQPAWGYPVLATQSVTFNLKASSIRRGKATTGSGKGSPAAAGRLITLQVQGKSGKWFNVATTREKSGGTFSFTIKGTSTGSFRYRAVAADLAGYLQFGYSNAKTLRVTA